LLFISYKIGDVVYLRTRNIGDTVNWVREFESQLRHASLSRPLTLEAE